MSRQEAHEPVCAAREGTVWLLIKGRSKDLGGFSVRRVMPSGVPRSQTHSR